MTKESQLLAKQKAYGGLVRCAGRFSLSLVLAISLFYPVLWAARANHLGILEAFSTAVFVSLALLILPWLFFWGPKMLRKITAIIIILTAAGVFVSPAVVILALPVLAAIVIIRGMSNDDEPYSNGLFIDK